MARHHECHHGSWRPATRPDQPCQEHQSSRTYERLTKRTAALSLVAHAWLPLCVLHTGGDPEGRRSVFGQMFRQLQFIPPAQLRQSGRTWHVSYLGEGSIDAGGPFRDSITHMCSELSSTMLPIFVPCANAQGFGENQDAWLPSPGARSSLHLSMLAFVGKLMGVSMRAKHILNLDLPPFVWKLLVGSEVTLEDLRDVDRLTSDVIKDTRAVVCGGGVGGVVVLLQQELMFCGRLLFGRRRPLRLMSCTPLACSLPPHQVTAAPSSWCLKAPPSQSRTLDTGGEWVVWVVTLTRQVFAGGE